MPIPKGTNPNRPPRGCTTTVSPIRDLKDIRAIKKLLADKPRDLALFTLGVNTNLRASDMLSLTVGAVKYLKPGDTLILKEKKTGKLRQVTINAQVVKAVQGWLKVRKDHQDSDQLFVGKRGVLTVPTVSNLVKSWCKGINLNGGNYGAHTLRKTWGYLQRVHFGMGLPELMVAFNHSSQKQTLDYLCVQPEEVRNCYLNEI